MNIMDEEAAGIDGEERRPRVQSVARAAAILFAVAGGEHGLSRKDISRVAGLSTQTTYHLLHTLSEAGLVTRGDNGHYVLGLRIGSLAEGFRRQLGGASQIAALVRAIARDTGETTYAAKWINGEVVSVDIVRGRHHIHALELPPGFAEDAHARAGGKVLLAFATDEMREEYFRTHSLRRRTPNTTISIKALNSQFDAIRSQHYAVENEEFAPGLSCVGVPLDKGISPYAIGVSAPTERFSANFDSYLQTLRKFTSAIG